MIFIPAEEYVPTAKVGTIILTYPMGEWLGGYATITEINPDPKAPEIVFQVKSLNGDEIGVYGNEVIGVSTDD